MLSIKVSLHLELRVGRNLGVESANC
jgi:hypothetical protein